jgi:uncharacterized protein DUF6158
MADVQTDWATMPGIPAEDLTDEDLLRELGELHRTRHDTLRHGSDQALTTHTERMYELEREYLRRFPQREVDPQRLRSGARTRDAGEVHPIEETRQVALAVDDEAPVAGLAPEPPSAGPTGEDLFREPRR